MSQQGGETRLRSAGQRVPVKGQGLLVPACFHDDETGAVGDAPAGRFRQGAESYAKVAIGVLATGIRR